MAGTKQSERRKASEDAVNRRLNKLKSKRSKEARRNVELAKAADTGPKDYNPKKDSAITGIIKEVKNFYSPNKTQKQRLFNKATSLRKKNKQTSKFQDKLLDPKKKTIESTKEYKEIIPKAMGGYRSGGLALKGYGKAYMKGGKVK